MANRFKCACEYGDNCTKTTMCAIDSAVEDQKSDFLIGLQRIQDVLDDPCWGNLSERIQEELTKLEEDL
jgi:hypothetical protein